MARPPPDTRILAPPPRPEAAALCGLGQAHSRKNPLDEGWEKLPGRPPNMEGPRCRHLLPPCGLEPETFEHAILTCPCRQGARSRLLHRVSSVGPDAPLWSSLPLLKRLATFISDASTGLPPSMFPPDTPPSSPPLPLSPLAVPPPAFRVFSLAEV